MRCFRLLIALLAALAFLVGTPTSASAEVPPGCRSVVRIDKDHRVTTEIVCADDEPQGDGLSSTRRVCMRGSSEVPCKSDQGSWYSPEQCYISPVNPLPPYTDPNWQGHTSGTLYYCRISGVAIGTPYIIWFADSVPPPDPETLGTGDPPGAGLRPTRVRVRSAPQQAEHARVLRQVGRLTEPGDAAGVSAGPIL